MKRQTEQPTLRARPVLWVGIGFVALLLLAACGSTIQPTAEPPPAAAPALGSQLPADFEITVYQGTEIVGGDVVDFSDLFHQGKPVVLNLWAGLCPPCRLEMPDLQEVSEEFGDEIILFGLDVGPFTNLGTSTDGQELLQQIGVTYPAGTTLDPQVVRDYGLIGMPTTYLITPNGEIVQQWTGLLTADKLAELVTDLLDASASS